MATSIAEAPDEPYQCTLTAALLKKAEDELKEKDTWRDRDIQALRDMVLAHKGLKSRIDSGFLLRFLRARKFDYDRAYALLINYFTVRAVNAEVLRELTPHAVSHVYDACIVSLLPHRDEEGRNILYFRPGKWNPNDMPMMDILRTNILNLELAVMSEETQVNGVVLIGNMIGLGLIHTKNIDRNTVRIMTRLIQESFPLRFKRIHIVNEPTIFGAVFAVVKPFLKEKTVSRLTFHGSSIESLKKHFDSSILPEELGGLLPSGDQLAAIWKVKAFEHQPMFEEMLKYKIEIVTEITTSRNEEAIECLVGTYKKLNVD